MSIRRHITIGEHRKPRVFVHLTISSFEKAKVTVFGGIISLTPKSTSEYLSQ